MKRFIRIAFEAAVIAALGFVIVYLVIQIGRLGVQ